MGKLLVLAGLALALAVAVIWVGALQSGLASLKSYVVYGEINEALKPIAERARRTAFLATANQVCAEQKQVRLTTVLPRKGAELIGPLRRLVRDEEETLADLSELKPPDGLEPAFARFLDDRKDVLAAADRLVRALEGRDRSASVRALEEVGRTSSSVNTYARAHGMPACEM
jgi:hypothetical protein